MNPLTCDQCQKEFAAKEGLEMHQLAKHTIAAGASKEERKQIKEEVTQQQRQKRRLFRRLKLMGLYGSIIFVIIALGWWISSMQSSGGTYSQSQIHWHAELQLNICGQDVPLPQPKLGTSVHGEPFVGTPFMHLHQGPVIHIEGIVQREEDIMLGKFMEVIGFTFTDTQLIDKKNGDFCPDGKAGKVQLWVNGRESPVLAQKVIVEGEKYELRFE